MNDIDKIEEGLIKIIGSENVKRNEPMSKHTTFRTGGPADLFVTPDISMIKEVMAFLRKYDVNYYVIGNGSNLLVSDKGFRGVIITLLNKEASVEFLSFEEFNNLRPENIDGYSDEYVFVKAAAGERMYKLGQVIADKFLTGFEFAAGIPGTVGGAVTMNAGAYGSEIKDILAFANVLDKSGHVKSLDAKGLELSYRSSNIEKNGYIVMSVVFALKKGKEEEIKFKIKELAAKRLDKQPLEYPSAGSTFKRPEGDFAGRLIEEAGLKGYRIGDAQVSEKHAGFVINRGKATSDEISKLIDYIILKVRQKTGVCLKPEVKRIG